MKKPFISIIIPCYNLQEYIQSCLESVFAQTFQDYEVVLVDDGSTDASAKIVSQVLEASGREHQVRLLTQNNGGVARARNLALAEARGEWVLFLDGDDELEPDALEGLAAKATEETDWVCAGRTLVDEEGRLLETVQLVPYAGTVDSWCARMDTMQGMYVYLFHKLYRRELILQNSIHFDERLRVSEDLAFNLDYLQAVRHITQVADASYRYRVRKGSLSHRVVMPSEHQNMDEHVEPFLASFSAEEQQKLLSANPIFCHYLWKFGVVNVVEAGLLSGVPKLRLQTFLHSDWVKQLNEQVQPQSTKDRLSLRHLKKGQLEEQGTLAKIQYQWLPKTRLYQLLQKL